MRIAGYEQFGGRHHDTSAIQHMLAHAGVVSPHTHAPFTEAMCLGLAGGIAAGYAFSPSIPNQETGSGVSVVGRYRAYVTGPEYHQGLFSRLGVASDVREATGTRLASKHLTSALDAGKPVIAWCSPQRLPYAGWAGTFGMYSLVVFGLDEEKDLALLSDRSPTPWPMSLDDLELSRKRICSHRNRLMTITAPREVSMETLRRAVLEGLSLCVRDLLVPRTKTWNLPGLLEWARVIASPRNKKGWLSVYSDGNFYPAMRDIFDSIETSGNGGQLFRPMYAEFLEEAASILERKSLLECAAKYREVGLEWQQLAEAMLPDDIAEFQRTKTLLRERLKLLETRGAEALSLVNHINENLRTIDDRMIFSFPYDEVEMEARLTAIAARIEALYDHESDAAEMLERALLQ